MKILDRYVISTFLKNYLIAFFVLIGLYITLDMVFNFDELVQVQEKAGGDVRSGIDSALLVIRAAGDYYFYQLFYIFVQLSGMIPVVAAAFTLIRLSRFNELSAMLSAGVPAPPHRQPDHHRRPDPQRPAPPRPGAADPPDHPQARALQAGGRPGDRQQGVPDPRHAGRPQRRPQRRPLPPGPRQPRHVRVHPRRAQPRPPARRHGHRPPRRVGPGTASWSLTEGRRVDGLLYDQGRKIDDHYTTYKSNVTPEEINLYRSGNYVELLSTHRIDELLDRPQSYGTVGLLRVKHSRFTQPLVNIILLLLAIACVLSREPTRLKSAATWCLLLTGLCMATTFLGQQLTGNPPNPTGPPSGPPSWPGSPS